MLGTICVVAISMISEKTLKTWDVKNQIKQISKKICYRSKYQYNACRKLFLDYDILEMTYKGVLSSVPTHGFSSNFAY